MLEELHVRELGVIAELRVELGPGMTALTGETGAGKTLLVEALDLVLGGRAEPLVVRDGAGAALVEARFRRGDDELLLAREVPASGRSRAFIDGRTVPVALLGEEGRALVDLHGQHAHQSLLHPSAQREALDRFAGVDHAPVQAARAALEAIESALAGLGGDARARAREIELTRYQLDEIVSARILSAGEEEEAAAEAEALANVAELREAAAAARDAISGGASPGALDLLGEALRALGERPRFAAAAGRLAAQAAELDDVANELRLGAETLEEDPGRLEEIGARRRLFRELCRKYGESLGEVISYGAELERRLGELADTAARTSRLEAERADAHRALDIAEEAVGDARRAGAPRLAHEVEAGLRTLALGRARLEVRLPPTGAADEVELLLSANPGEPPLPLARVASGGELARAMLALRLVLSAGPPTLVFDEVDAGVGGEAALAVGRALAELAGDHQVLVVTHLAQVAAFATTQIAVRKGESAGRTVVEASPVSGPARVAELARMLSGHPDSDAARRHAEELLALGGRSAGRRRVASRL